MRLLVLSDLHREVWLTHSESIDLAISKPDLVVLAGDIDTGIKAIEWASVAFAGLPVLYVHGNHEAYGKNLEDMQEKIQAACEGSGHIHFLNSSEYLTENIRFLGTTLWTDFCLFGEHERPFAMQAAQEAMIDYRRIRLAKKKYRKLRASDTALFHAEQLSWLKQKLAEPFEGKTVVVTHMAPSLLSVSEQYASDPVSAAFASRLDDLVTQCDLWIHGHMHTSFDYRIGRGRVVCNPRGYCLRTGPENPHFDPNFVVEI